MDWWRRLYAKTVADPGKSMAGCLLANVLLVLLFALFFLLAGETPRWLR